MKNHVSVPSRVLERLKQKLRLCLDLGRFRSAENLLRSHLRRWPENGELQCLSGIVSYRQSRFSEALSQFRKASRLSQPDSRGSLSLIAVLCDMGQYQAARDFAERLADNPKTSMPEHNPENLTEISTGHYEAANKYARLYLWDQAINEYRQAILVSPDHEASRIALARLYLDQGRDQEAKCELLELTERNPLSSEAHLMLGMISLREGKKASAGKSWEKALRCDPKNPAVRACARLSQSWVRTSG